MKRSYFILIILFCLSGINVESQTTPLWIDNINSLPDSAFVLPERTLNDDSNHVFVLCTYQKTISPGNFIYKIILKKFDSAGSLIWTLDYDNNGTGSPRGYDMVIEHNGCCYIAGALMASVNYQPLLLKVNSAGTVAWSRDSTNTFNSGNYDQVFLYNYNLYVKGSDGIAKFDLNGNEQWSHNASAGRMAVDNSGQSIVSLYSGASINILRYDSSGVLNFSDSTIYAKRIATDADNNFYLLTDNYPVYNLVKYDSSGNLSWSINSFISSASFGDISFDVLTDYNKDVILAGLSDTIYKLSPSGNLIFKKSMDGLDSYLISAKITFNNLIVVAGSAPDTSGYYMKVETYNSIGDVNWSGVYNSNPFTQEYTVDVSTDNSGVYVIENNNQNTTLVKFDVPFNSAIDYNLICVDSVWYDTSNPLYVNVRIYNGNASSLNYPSEMGISSSLDTIINPHNTVTFFAQLGNTYQTYHDSISLQGISDFSNYTFLMSEGFGDTTVSIGWCFATGVNYVYGSEIKIYPNPAYDFLIVENTGSHDKNSVLQIFSITGTKVWEGKLSTDVVNSINISGYNNGIYFARLTEGKNVIRFKFIKY